MLNEYTDVHTCCTCFVYKCVDEKACLNKKIKLHLAQTRCNIHEDSLLTSKVVKRVSGSLVIIL